MLHRIVGRASVVAASAVTALALTACSSGAGSESAAPAASSDVAAAASEFAGLDASAQQARLATSASDLEQQLLVLSGLDKKLGGGQQAVTAYQAMTARLVTRAQKYVAPSFGRTGAGARDGGAPGLGAMTFAGMMLASLAADGIVGGSNKLEPGEHGPQGTKTDTSGNDSTTTTMDSTTASASLDTTAQTVTDGVTGKVRVQMTINPCPGPDGVFTATTKISTSAAGAGGAGSTMIIDMKLTGRIDDDAKLVSYDVETTSSAGEASSSDSRWGEVTDRQLTQGGTITSYTRTPGRSAGSASPKFVNDLASTAMMVQVLVTRRVLDAAQKGWESGRCVALQPTTDPAKRSGLQPSTSITIKAAPRSKLDGLPTGGTVTGTLSGDTSLDPNGSKTQADATFTYVAPEEKGKSATVSLEARSKRGVATATITFDTKESSYDVAGHLASVPAGTEFSGTICDVTKPFTVATSGDQVGTIAFTPTSDTAGKLVFTGKVGNAPFAMTGKGTYTVTPPQSDTGTLDITWRVTIKIPVVGDQTRGGTVALTLTPRQAC